MTLELSNGEKVVLVDRITWGIKEAIQSELVGAMSASGAAQNINLNAAGISAAKYKALELCIEKIIGKDGTEAKFSRAWMENLSVEDGDAVYEAVDALSKPKK